MKEFDLEELSQFNGDNGKPIYIAAQGKVIDVSDSKLWKTGLHMKRHRAGKDLTTDLKAAPHDLDRLDRFSQVGVLKKDASEREIPQFLASLIRKYPLLRRHPHPMTVHFPIVFMFSTTLFNILYLVTGIKAFETTALHCLGAGILFTPVSTLTGWYTWWLNYMAKPTRATTIKKRASLILFSVELIVFGWRLSVPDILDSFGLASTVYFLLILSLSVQVTIIGWFGAHLTFPVEE